MLFTSEQVNETSGCASYLTESYLYHDQDESEQDDVEIVVPEKFRFIFPQEGKYSESEFAGMANPNFGNVQHDLEKETYSQVIFVLFPAAIFYTFILQISYTKF